MEEGWLLDWVERAREEIDPLGSIQAFCLQKLFIFSSRNPSSDGPPAQPGHEGHLLELAQLPLAGGGILTNTTSSRVKSDRSSQLNVSGSWQEEGASYGGPAVPWDDPGCLLKFQPVPTLFHLLLR